MFWDEYVTYWEWARGDAHFSERVHTQPMVALKDDRVCRTELGRGSCDCFRQLPSYRQDCRPGRELSDEQAMDWVMSEEAEHDDNAHMMGGGEHVQQASTIRGAHPAGGIIYDECHQFSDEFLASINVGRLRHQQSFWLNSGR